MRLRSVLRLVPVMIVCWPRVLPAQRSLGADSEQGSLLRGLVLDPDRKPVPDAEVDRVDRGTIVARARTDADGRFAIEAGPTDTTTLRVRRLGFQIRSLAVIRPPIGATLAPIVVERSAMGLDTLHLVEDPDTLDPRLAEFRARAATNRFGHFIREEDIDARQVTLASELLLSVPGVTVRPARRGGNQVRIRGCAPLIWVDGQRARGAELDDVVRASDVGAMEIYSSTAGVPAEYTDRSATCGTILVWMRTR